MAFIGENSVARVDFIECTLGDGLLILCVRERVHDWDFKNAQNKTT